MSIIKSLFIFIQICSGYTGERYMGFKIFFESWVYKLAIEAKNKIKFSRNVKFSNFLTTKNELKLQQPQFT